MNTNQVVLHGIVKPDGTLEVTQPVQLPPGEVQITVELLAAASPSQENVWTVLDRVWADREARGLVPRTREEINAQINAIRDEAEEDFRKLECIRSACEHARDSTKGT